ncbi:MAG TPA: energy transducer TonB [Bryobacteraceae bacterium]|nr:energy transducer TonB [Bryobacteraceae bacterium]
MSELRQVPEEGKDPVKADHVQADSPTLAGASNPPVDADADIHLSRLLVQNVEIPWYRSIGPAIKELIHPPKLPPLEITSKPVDVKDQWGMYKGNESKAGVLSLAGHIAVIALLLWLSSLKPVQKAIQEVIPLFAPDLKPYISSVKKDKSGGGGGGGTRSPLDASKGKLPKPAPKQFTPPRVDPIDNPKLPMTPTIVAPNDIPNITANNLGDPLSRLGIPSNGGGFGGGIGSGNGGGVGSGRGPGVGPGSGGGFGGGAYRIGGGVSAPTVLVKVEPEYSEEARKAKWQGTVVLSLVVDENGSAQGIKVTKSLGLGLDQKAIEAVLKWRFKPGMKDGKPVPVMASIEVNFRLL